MKALILDTSGTVRVSWDSTAGDNYWDVTFPASSKEPQIISVEASIFFTELKIA